MKNRNKKIIIVVVFCLLIVSVYVYLISLVFSGYTHNKDGRRASNKWFLFFSYDQSFSSGFHSPSKYNSLDECKNAGESIYKNESATYPQKEFLCATICVQPLDGTRPDHCDDGILAKCSGGTCKYFDNLEKTIYGNLILTIKE